MRHFPQAVISRVLVALVTGCVVAPRGAYHDPYRQDQVLIQVAPPPPQEEVIGVAPYVGHIWLGGAWFWQGGRHVWRPGHWEAPRPRHIWVPHHWQHNGHSWHFREGYWNRHR